MMLKELLKFLCNYKPAIRLFLKYKAAYCENFMLVNDLKREVPIIISLSSTEKHFKYLEYTLCSIQNQKVKPDRVILWLSNEYELSELPYCITKYIKNGLEIKFVEECSSFTKIIYALKEFKNSILITAEDDIYYQKTWLARLYHSYISSPRDIHVHKAHKIIATNDLTDYKKWGKYINDEDSSYTIFPLNAGGILYPPNCFSREVFRDDIYRKKTKIEWDLWAWFMSLVANRKIRVVKNHIKYLNCINIFERLINYIKAYRRHNNINKQIYFLMKYYGQNINQKMNTK